MTEMQTRTGAVPEFDLADRIRRSMRHADIGSAELAERLEVSRTSVSNWANGHHAPRPRDLKAIAEICGVDLHWLLHGSPSQERWGSATGRGHLVEARVPAHGFANPPRRTVDGHHRASSQTLTSLFLKEIGHTVVTTGARPE